MTRFTLLALVACSSAPSSTTKPTPPAPPDAAVATSPDAAIAAPPVDAPPAVDPELAAAPPSVFRFYATGLAMKKEGQRLETWTLRTVGERATILVERMRPDGDAWILGTTTLYLGTAAVDGKGLKLALAAGPNQLALACKREKLAVAAANAVRKPHPKKGKFAGECSGDPGRWVPEKTKSIDVLSCKHPDYEAPMPFAAAPGVEYVFVNDDCDQQGGGYRALASDGAVAPVR